MPVEMQAKLLTVLEDKEIRRLGAEQDKKVKTDVSLPSGHEQTARDITARTDLAERFVLPLSHEPD